MGSINYRKGDASNPVGRDKRLIVHICNDIGGWGKGFVLALSQKWKEPEKQYREWFKSQENFELGQVQFVPVEPNIFVANMIGQHKIKKTDGQIPIRYEAVEQCLNKVAEFALKNQISVHMPRIGCGLAGGKWEEIETIISRRLLNKNVKVTVYDIE
ncbi:MAG: macro domain-containing protein [Flavobacteriales bacterium]|nr:macro domain-containing protein [Flavobacteriales bacterium]